MLVTDRFVFVHIPKTSGPFIQTVIREHLPVLDRKAAIREAAPDRLVCERFQYEFGRTSRKLHKG